MLMVEPMTSRPTAMPPVSARTSCAASGLAPRTRADSSPPTISPRSSGLASFRFVCTPRFGLAPRGNGRPAHVAADGDPAAACPHRGGRLNGRRFGRFVCWKEIDKGGPGAGRRDEEAAPKPTQHEPILPVNEKFPKAPPQPPALTRAP